LKLHRKRFSPEFKATVALEVVKGERPLNVLAGQVEVHLTQRLLWKSVAQLARQYGVHPAQVSQWKRRLMERACEVFKKPKGRRDQRCRQLELAQQGAREEESWMMNVLQGRLSARDVANTLAAVMPTLDAQRLHWCVTNETERYRTRALAMLALKKGIRKSTIWHFLKVGSHYVDSVDRHYQAEGIQWFGKHKQSGLRKHELEHYKEAVFAILHSPPSAHGINRTTWRVRDIRKVMSKQHAAIGKNGIQKIIHNAGYKFRKAKVCLTSNDPAYEQKVQEIMNILAELKPDERFFSIDEFGPFAVKMQAGRSYTKPGQERVVPQFQKSKGVLIVTAALELSENQVTHFYSAHKNTEEMLKLLEVLLVKYAEQSRIYISWDAASWHASKSLCTRVEEINRPEYQAAHKCPLVKLAPLPSRAQFLNVIESVFSGMAKAIIHNSDYQSVNEAVAAIDMYFAERNQEFKDKPKRAGGKIWRKEIVVAKFREANNCKDERYMQMR
jgi:transposase-like protein